MTNPFQRCFNLFNVTTRLLYAGVKKTRTVSKAHQRQSSWQLNREETYYKTRDSKSIHNLLSNYCLPERDSSHLKQITEQQNLILSYLCRPSFINFLIANLKNNLDQHEDMSKDMFKTWSYSVRMRQLPHFSFSTHSHNVIHKYVVCHVSNAITIVSNNPSLNWMNSDECVCDVFNQTLKKDISQSS